MPKENNIIKLKPIVAIDGPAGSGKSTVTKMVAKKAGLIHIDTGALYRAIALKAINNKVDLKDEKALDEISKNIKLEFKLVNEVNRLFADDIDVSDLVRTEEAGKGASAVSAIPKVRENLLDLQRKLGDKGGIVLEGRDIGTVVFPNADCKFFVTASVEERAKRRRGEYLQKGKDISLEEIKKDIEKRDHDDSTRAIAPLKKADDAELVDTTGMSIEEVVDYICGQIKLKSK